MKIVKVICILLFVPLLGICIASIIAALLLPYDPTGRGAPGDGIMILGCLVVGLVVSLIIAILLAIWTWRRSPKPDTPS